MIRRIRFLHFTSGGSWSRRAAVAAVGFLEVPVSMEKAVAGVVNRFYRPRREKHMDIPEIRKYLHDLSNALNAAKINAYLLRRMHGDQLDKETADGLDSALMDAERLVADFHRRVHAEMSAEKVQTV